MPDRLQYVGDPSLNFKDFEVRSSTKGMTTHFRVTSPIISNLIAYHNYIVTFGASVVARGFDGGEERSLEVEVPGLTDAMLGIINEWLPDQWELVTNENADSIFNNPLLIGGPSPVLNYNDRVVLSRLARMGGTSRVLDAVESCNADIPYGLRAPPVPPGKFVEPTSAVGRQLVIEILKNQDIYRRPTYVLRHTSYCNANSRYNSSVAGAERIYSVAQFLDEVGSGWNYSLPIRLYTKVAGIPVMFAPNEEAGFYAWGWLKAITRETLLANFMVEVSSEYELGLWSTLRYALR